MQPCGSYGRTSSRSSVPTTSSTVTSCCTARRRGHPSVASIGTNCSFSTRGFDRSVTGIFQRTQLINSTVVENHAPIGGGVSVSSSGPFDFINVTIADNTSGMELGSGVAWDLGNRVSFFNTLLWNNNCGGTGPPQTNGHNMEGPSGTCFLPGNGDQTDVPDVGLGPLGDHGGTTEVRPLLPDSLAIDAALTDDCPATDQRGSIRPRDGDGDGTADCDIGAYEADGVTVLEIPSLNATGRALFVVFLAVAGGLFLRRSERSTSKAKATSS